MLAGPESHLHVGEESRVFELLGIAEIGHKLLEGSIGVNLADEERMEKMS